MLTAATCERVSNRCSKETAPVGCFNKGRTCQECCSNLSLSSDCWDVSAGITFSACCNSCLNQAPANGVLGGSCALVLPDRTTCVPECNPGFQLLGNTRCTSGFLSPATCEKIQICNLATSFQLSRSSNGSSSLVDSAIHARFEMAQASLVAVPYLTIVSASTSRETLMARTGQLGHLHVGSGEFVAVGMHAGVIMVDQQPCVRTILDLSLECRAGFTWNGRRCAITADQSVCAMTTISLSQRAGPRLLFDLRGRALFGSNLSFATAQPRLNSCHAVWVPVPEASLRFSVRTRVRLDYIGRYTIKGQCPSQDSCFFSRFGQYTMVCPFGQQAVGRLCKQVQLNCTDSFLLEGGQCKRKPKLAVSCSTVLLIEVEKLDPLHSTASVPIDAKLTAGQSCRQPHLSHSSGTRSRKRSQ